ncbi:MULTISPECIES: HAD-IB family hydrolase [Acinetobacter]|uniref:HAD-IB family hydrolase n=1 Tax=Acinetobacter TaxID=469 RepID=UPI0015D2DD66|nr:MULTISPECIES: HAD-IB family hydrolase [Acinetobacter]MBF4521598.1 HAD-IB family hydrolase [Acinetobacter towneri]MDM1282450.1 HAD-IB family hydrolase [Acinetobacter towneri]
MHAKSQKYKNLALFDFDGTLCSKDSFTGFIFYALSKRHIIKQGLKTLPWIQAYYLKVYPAHAMRPKLFSAMFKDASTAEILALAQRYAADLMHDLNPQLLLQLKQHQFNGDDVVVVSASVDIYLQYICQQLNVGLICTETEIESQQFTGQYSTPDCSREQKQIRILEQYDLKNYAAIYAYGNSDEDEAMLSLATHPYMVGVDQTLPEIMAYKKLA